MNVLVASYSETGNTAQIAQAISEAVARQGHEVGLCALDAVSPSSLGAYDLVFLGSACHDADLARPVKGFLGGLPIAPAFKLAGFVTHAAYMPEGGAREREAHKTWASRCAVSFRESCQDKGIDFAGYFGCQGAPSPPIAQFIRDTIVTDEDEWQEYIQEARGHPNEHDLRRAGEFVRQVLTGVSSSPGVGGADD
jgi:flavodoxin